MSDRKPHTRHGYLHWHAKVLCREHGTVQVVTDVFVHPDGLILLLECGHKRGES